MMGLLRRTLLIIFIRVRSLYNTSRRSYTEWIEFEGNRKSDRYCPGARVSYPNLSSAYYVSKYEPFSTEERIIMSHGSLRYVWNSLRVSLFLVDSEPALDLQGQFMQTPIFTFSMIPLRQWILKLLHEYIQIVSRVFWNQKREFLLLININFSPMPIKFFTLMRVNKKLLAISIKLWAVIVNLSSRWRYLAKNSIMLGRRNMFTFETARIPNGAH